MPKNLKPFCLLLTVFVITLLSTREVTAAAPTCTLNPSTTNFTSLSGLSTEATVVNNSGSNASIKWESNYGTTTPTDPTSPVDAQGFIDLGTITSSSPNELENPSMEDPGVKFWFVDNISNGYAVVSDGEEAKTGTKALKLHKDTNDGVYYDLRWIKDEGGFYVEPGDEYVVEAWVNTQEVNGNFGTLFMVMTQYRLEGSTWIEDSWPSAQIDEATGGWQKISLDVTVPSNVTRVRLEFMLGGRGTAYIDDVYFAHGTNLSPPNILASADWVDSTETDTPLVITATVKNGDGQNTCSTSTLIPTVPPPPTAPTCTIRENTFDFYSDSGVEVFADVENYESSETKIRWTSSYGSMSPSIPSAPIDGDGYVTLSEGGGTALPPNMLNNPTFEDANVEFWPIDNVSVGYAAITDGEEARSGSRALKLHRDSWEGDDTDLRWLKDDGGFYVNPGDYYTAEVWVNAVPKESGAFGTLYMSLVKYRLDGGSWVFSGTTHVPVEEPTSGWQKISVTEEIPWQVTRIRMEFRLGGYGSAYFDDAHFSTTSEGGSATSFPASANWSHSGLSDTGVTVTAQVKNAGGESSCSKILYPVLPNTNLEIKVKETADTNKASLEGFCEDFSSYSYASSPTTATISKLPSSTQYLQETQAFNGSYSTVIEEYPTTSEPSASYGFLLDISDNYSDKEIKCVKHIKYDQNGNQVSSNIHPGSTLSSFTATRGGTEEIQVVIGNKPVYPWFKAFGGQIYSFGGIDNDIPPSYGTYLESIGLVNIGPVSGKGTLTGNLPAAYVQNYDVSESQIDQLLQIVQNNPSFVKTVSNQNNINPNNPRDIYLWDGSLPLVLDKDIKRLPNMLTPILIVDGDVVITSDVEEINAYVIATGKITVQERYTNSSSTDTGTCVTEYSDNDSENPWEEEIYQTYGCNEAGTWCGWDTWPSRKTKTFNKPEGANFAIIKHGWRWSGHTNDTTQKTEQHYIDSPLGLAFCKDLGDFGDFPVELKENRTNSYLSVDVFPCDPDGTGLLGGSVSGPVSGDLEIETYISNDMVSLQQGCTPPDYQDCNSSHRAVVEVIWCDSVEEVQTFADPLVVYGGLLAKGVSDVGIEFERPIDNFDPIDYAMEELYYMPEIYFTDVSDLDLFKVRNVLINGLD